MPHTQTKTQTVTNTQLATAVVAAFLAGGLAFAAAPAKQFPAPASPQCKPSSVQFANPCGKNMYKTRSFTCSDGFSPALVQRCMSVEDIQKEAERVCSQRKCVQAVVANNPPANPPVEPVHNLTITNNDLSIRAGDFPGSVVISARVSNNGNVPVPSLGQQALDAQIFAESERDENQAFLMGTLEYISLVGLQPGQSRTLELPRLLNPKTRFVRVALDGFEDITESNESDNIAIIPVVPEFLGPGNITFANNIVNFVKSPTGTTRITANIINNDMNPFPTSTVVSYYFLNGFGEVLNGEDTVAVLGQSFVNNPNRSLPYIIGLNIDRYLMQGAVSLRIKLDSRNVAFESDETDNEITVPIPEEFIPEYDPQVR